MVLLEPPEGVQVECPRSARRELLRRRRLLFLSVCFFCFCFSSKHPPRLVATSVFLVSLRQQGKAAIISSCCCNGADSQHLVLQRVGFV